MTPETKLLLITDSKSLTVLSNGTITRVTLDDVHVYLSPPLPRGNHREHTVRRTDGQTDMLIIANTTPCKANKLLMCYKQVCKIIQIFRN